MPTLKDLVCHVQWADTGSPFPEYGTVYGDGVVEAYIAIPTHPQVFTIRLTSRKFIYDGLAMVVFIDGNYQCNRNRVNLQPAKKNLPEIRTNIDFLVRQKEKPMGDGTYMGRQWRFDDCNLGESILEEASSKLMLRYQSQNSPRALMSATSMIWERSKSWSCDAIATIVKIVNARRPLQVSTAGSWMTKRMLEKGRKNLVLTAIQTPKITLQKLNILTLNHRTPSVGFLPYSMDLPTGGLASLAIQEMPCQMGILDGIGKHMLDTLLLMARRKDHNTRRIIVYLLGIMKNHDEQGTPIMTLRPLLHMHPRRIRLLRVSDQRGMFTSTTVTGEGRSPVAIIQDTTTNPITLGSDMINMHTPTLVPVTIARNTIDIAILTPTILFLLKAGITCTILIGKSTGHTLSRTKSTKALSHVLLWTVTLRNIHTIGHLFKGLYLRLSKHTGLQHLAALKRIFRTLFRQ
ncbi:uncharacterized protein A1O5_07665 [Cladophialophora psammophila CBS 110553]|uniref:Uncharacterized protein n=1 Tax=Cladophialophora psammophila CBS 110553 TaxID=1182543 RepID=W9XGZ1_9EURO|nr:uncharacterized protein A1O5_07665 [Cladophialophora psammophila CBS 110553]EXJ69629.1 hypothetical protein A1O5_07665 [Cladophialophora psammophila CBS 110553]